ncbi:unnamed protein product, partial [Rotaria socialis]
LVSTFSKTFLPNEHKRVDICIGRLAQLAYVNEVKNDSSRTFIGLVIEDDIGTSAQNLIKKNGPYGLRSNKSFKPS